MFAIIALLTASVVPVSQPDEFWVRTTRDIRAISVEQVLLTSQINTGDDPIAGPGQGTIPFTLDVYVHGSTGSPTPNSWSSPISTLREGPDINTPLPFDQSEIPGHHYWEFYAKIDRAAQYDLWVDESGPHVANLSLIPVETWEKWQTGNSTPEDTISRSMVDMLGTLVGLERLIEVLGGDS
jgi:hypothetical protein